MNSNFEFGQVKISTDVISSIVAIAVEETEGFKMVKTLVDKIISKNQSVKASFNEPGNLILTVDISVEYGLKIHKEIPKVQDNIINNLEMMTGLKVDELNINVNNLYFKEK